MEIYEKPEIEIIEVRVEVGFAISSLEYSSEDASLDHDAL